MKKLLLLSAILFFSGTTFAGISKVIIEKDGTQTLVPFQERTRIVTLRSTRPVVKKTKKTIVRQRVVSNQYYRVVRRVGTKNGYLND